MTTPLHTRVGQLVRLLSSDQVGEAGAAALALNRAINAAGRDIHWLAEIVAAALAEPPAEKADDALEWLCVDSLTLRRHEKLGRKPTLRVQYHCGTSTFCDWWAFQHDGVAREIAVEKWRRLGGDLPAPATINEAINRQDELCADVEISVRRAGRYWSVTGQRPRRGVAA
jgi:hypothetical protein